MNIAKKEENGIVTVKPEGWLDTVTSPELGEVIESIDKATGIVLDFDMVEYMASSGLRQVVAAHKKARSLDAEFSVINVSGEVMSIFHMTGIDKKLDIKAKN